MVADAFWEVTPTDYVSPYPPLPTGLLDDPERLHASWSRALAGWRSQDALPFEAVEAAFNEYLAELPALEAASHHTNTSR